jgi:transcriptional regulator of acetoin/glycerol metabolism
MTKFEATKKIHAMRQIKPVEEIIKDLGISRPTFYTRLKKHNWKKSEVCLIENIKL